MHFISLNMEYCMNGNLSKINILAKKSLEQKYQKQKNKNLYNLKNTLIKHPEFSDVINPLISYLESNKTFEDAENNIPNLLIEIAKDSK